MAKLARVRSALAKIESTYGTDPTPTGSADAVQLRNLEVQPAESEVLGLAHRPEPRRRRLELEEAVGP